MAAVPLNRANLVRLQPPVRVPHFDPARVTAGIVHLGPGGFHRAHMARYTHNLMETHPDALSRGIIGAGLMPADRRMQESPGPQDNLYTLVERDAASETVTVIGSPRMNFLPATVAESGGGGTTVAQASGQRIVVPLEAGTARPSDAVTLGIRPEGLRIDPAGPITADVTLVERLGGLTLLHAKAPGDQDITVQIEGSDATKAHGHLRLAVDPEATHLFDKAGHALPHLGRHPMAA